MIRFMLVALCLIWATACDSRAPASDILDGAATDGGLGIYVTTPFLDNQRDLLSQAVIDQSGVAGVAIRLRWNQIEPANGSFDWSLLDQTVRSAVDSGKSISIGVTAGDFAPEWLKAEGVRFLSFEFPRQRCVTSEVPIPWEPNYIAAYNRMMTAIRDHIANLGALESVRAVKLTAIAQATFELRLPRNNRCSEDNDTIWMENGYRSSLIMDSWTATAGHVGRLFPNALLIQPILEDDGFPAIDDNGRAIRRDQRELRDDIIAEGVARFGARLAVMNTALRPEPMTDLRAVALHRRGASLTFQANMYRGREGSGCQRNRREADIPCSAQAYQRLLANGWAMGANYIEIWPSDATRFSDMVRQNARPVR